MSHLFSKMIRFVRFVKFNQLTCHNSGASVILGVIPISTRFLTLPACREAESTTLCVIRLSSRRQDHCRQKWTFDKGCWSFGQRWDRRASISLGKWQIVGFFLQLYLCSNLGLGLLMLNSVSGFCKSMLYSLFHKQTCSRFTRLFGWLVSWSSPCPKYLIIPFEKPTVQGHQKWYSGLSNTQIH